MNPPSLRPLLWLLLPLFAGACATAPDPAASLPPGPYMRVARPDADTIALQIAVRRFTPARGAGPAVWLTAVSHLGDSNYYATLQRHLDAQAIVLFEGVKDESEKRDDIKTRLGKAARRAAEKKSSPDAPAADPASLQSIMAESLGLVFQLEAIDYSGDHFRNSDLSVQQIQRLMSGDRSAAPASPRGKTPRSPRAEGSQEFDKLLQMMDGSSVMGGVLNLGLKIIGSSPKLQALTRLVMIETLGQLRGDITQMKGLPPEMKDLITILIQERNKAALADLKSLLRQKPAPASVSIFYGAGHMDDLERRLRQDYKYACREEQWFTAFAVNTRQSGLSAIEQDMIHTLVKGVMDTMHP